MLGRRVVGGRPALLRFSRSRENHGNEKVRVQDPQCFLATQKRFEDHHPLAQRIPRSFVFQKQKATSSASKHHFAVTDEPGENIQSSASSSLLEVGSGGQEEVGGSGPPEQTAGGGNFGHTGLIITWQNFFG